MVVTFVPKPDEPRFTTPIILTTPAVLDFFISNQIDMLPYFHRHFHGDWGELGEEDTAQQEREMKAGGWRRMFSVFTVAGRKIWLISYIDTGDDHTTMMFPEEY